jgi:hypothetical protein
LCSYKYISNAKDFAVVIDREPAGHINYQPGATWANVFKVLHENGKGREKYFYLRDKCFSGGRVYIYTIGTDSQLKLSTHSKIIEKLTEQVPDILQ